MPRFIAFFSLTGDALARFIENPEDRTGPVRQAVETAGGRLESYYWMFGEHDGFEIFEMPDSASAASFSLATNSSGAIKHIETHELISADDLVRVLQKAKDVRSSYRPPGSA